MFRVTSWIHDFIHFFGRNSCMQAILSVGCNYSYLTTIDICLSMAPNSLISFHWRHNGHDGVSNHQPHDCLLNRLFRRRSKKISKLRVTNLCAGNPPVTGEFLAQRATNAENVSIWWRHHVVSTCSLRVNRGYQIWYYFINSLSPVWCGYNLK